MDQPMDDDEKDGTSTQDSDMPACGSGNDGENASLAEQLNQGFQKDDEFTFRGNRKRPAESQLGAPKPKIKKKLHAVISELKSSKEVPSSFPSSIPDAGEFDSHCSQNLGSVGSPVLDPTSSEGKVIEGNSDVSADQLMSDERTSFSDSKQFLIGKPSDSSNCENIYRPQVQDSASASASPKVKCKYTHDHSLKRPNSRNRSSPLTESRDDSNSPKTSRLSPEQPDPIRSENDEISGTVGNSKPHLPFVPDHSNSTQQDVSQDVSDGAPVSYGFNRCDKLDSIPVAKVDPLMEPSEEAQLKNDSDSDTERGTKSSDSDHERKTSDNETKNSDNETKNSDNEMSDCDDVAKDSLMGGPTGLSARPKVKNMRKNIRDILADDHLEEDTLAAQKEEQLRLQRLQEKRVAMREYLEQQQVERMVAEVAEAAEAVTAAEAVQEVEEAEDSSQAEPFTDEQPESLSDVKKEPLETEDDDDVVVLSSEGSDAESKDSEPDDESVNESKAGILLQPKMEVKSEKGSDTSESEESESDSDSDVVVLSHSEDEGDIDEDVNNCGAHVNDDCNAADVNGRVLVNVGHPENEEDIFLAPQLAAAIKPHQIGGLRFLYDNIVESLEQFKTSNGFGCILAHSMGLGKTLQVISLTDVFLRHTGSKSVLIIVPINTLQNWLAEYNQWLPDEVPSSVPEGTEFRPRNFKIFLSNDGQKSMKTRAKVIDDWHQQGGVLLMGYEMYRQLSLKKGKKPKKRKRKNADEIVDIEEEDINKEYLDEMYKALVRPGPDLIICDEGHRIKNAHANISQALKSIRTRRRVVLTGYPLQNNLLEYWCMVDFVRPNYLGSKTEFSNMFERPIQNGQCVDSTPQDVKLMRYRAHVLHSLLEGFVQRRGHSVLANTLPTKHEHVILCRLTPIQRQLYNAYMAELTINKGMANPLKAFAICCKIWNHPDILYNLVMKRLNQDHDLDLDEVVGKSGAKTKKPTPTKAADKKKGAVAKPISQKILPPNEHRGVPPPVSAAQKQPISSEAATAPMNMQPGFQPSGMGPPQMIPSHQSSPQQQQQQRPPMGNNANEHSNVNMGYPYPNMYNMQAQSSYMNQMPYPWGYNQSYPPDTNAPYMPPYNMYSPQYPHSMQQNQQEMPPYPMPPPGHMSGMAPTNQVCSQSVARGQRNTNELGDNHNRQQNGGCMPDGQQQQQQQLESMETNSHPDDRGSVKECQQMMAMPHNASGARMDQNMALGQDMRSGMTMQMGMQDSNCKYNYASPSPKISDQMNNLAIDQKASFGGGNRHGLDDIKPQLMQGQNMQTSFAPKEGMLNFEAGSQDSNGKLDLEDDKKEEFKKEEKIREEVSLEWAESFFKDYIPGLLETSTKFMLFFHILEGSVTIGDRVLVFSQSLFTLSQLEEFLQKSVIPGTTEKWAKNRTYFRLDGSTASQERAMLINEFNNNPIVRVFLVSTRAGSLGINLVGANRVVVFDASFNPCHDTQAVCRVYRYGQRKDCHIYRLVTDNSLERRIYDRQVNKQGISDRIVDEMNPEAHLSSKEISNLLVEKEEEPTNEDFCDMVDEFHDPIFKGIVKDKSYLVTRPPFKHESLLVDRKDKKLSNAEKRLAKRSYELEKQANISYNRSSYSSFYPKTSGAMATKIGGVVYAKPVGTVRPMQVDGRHRIEGGMSSHPNILSRSPNTPVESLAKQGVSVQQITVPKDVSIPTNSGDGKTIQLKGGQSVMVIKTQKGMYLRLSDGKIVAIRIPPGNEDAFGLPLNQGSVTIVPTVFPTRGRSVGAGRGGSSIRRGRPPLSAQYALGNVVPKGYNNSQMAVRIIRKPIGAGRGGGKATFQTMAGSPSGQGTLLNKSVVITPAKPGGKKVAGKDAKISPKVQITAVPPKPGGLASIGGTSGLNRRLNRNNKLFFQHGTTGKADEFINKPAFAMGSDVAGAKPAFAMGSDAVGARAPADYSDSSSDDGDSAASSGERSPPDPAADLPGVAFAVAEKPTPTEVATKVLPLPVEPADIPKIDAPAVEENKSTFGGELPAKDQNSPIERNLNVGPSEKIVFNPMPVPLVVASNDAPVSNTKPDALPPPNMLNPLSQLSNLLPPGEKESRPMPVFNTMPQPTQQSYSQPSYSNHQLFQPYLQQSTPSSSSATVQQPPQLPMVTSDEPVKSWPRHSGSEMNPMNNSMHTPMTSMAALKPQPTYHPALPVASHYQNAPRVSEAPTNKLQPPTPYQSEVNQNLQPTNVVTQQSTDGGEKRSNIDMNQMMTQTVSSSLPSNSPLSLSNILSEPLASDIPVNPASTPIDYMNYSSAFRRVEYPASEVHAATTSEIGVSVAPPYSTTVAAPSPSFNPAPNPPPYSQYQVYGNHNFRAPPMNPSGYPYANQFSPYDHYGALGASQGPPQPPVPLQQQYPGNPNQENYNYGGGSLPPYAPGLSNFGQGPYPPM